MSSIFLRLVEPTGSRVKNHMGVEMDEGVVPTLSRKYQYIEIPVRLPEDTVIKRNQHVFIPAAAHIHIKGSNVVAVEANRVLAEYGAVQPMQLIHPGEERSQLGIWFTAHKQLDLAELTHCVRLYMLA